MMNQEVRTIMTKEPVVAHPDQNIDQVTNLMIASDLQQLPVVKDGKLVGMITAYDLWKSQRQSLAPETLISDVMTKKIIHIAPKDKIGTAAELFADQRFKTLPVVNLEGELKGIVTAFDVIRASFNEEYQTPILYKEVFSR
jgi:CBS domain-containing protein